MNITHFSRKENSGLFRTMLELARYEEKAGHDVTIKQPSDDKVLYGSNTEADVELIHSQLAVESYFNGKSRHMFMHGEPLSSVANGVSMKAIVDLAPLVDSFICMRKDEHMIWNSIKKTYLVPKGVDLEVYHPVDDYEKLPGEPAVLYVENWRGQRNPLYVCLAMQEVWKKYPKARLHLLNCQSPKMHETFKTLINNNKWWVFIKSLLGPVSADKINELYNRADIVVSGLYPLYARGIEAFGAGKAYIGAGYREHDDYPFMCDFHPQSMADAIVKCWENYDQIDFRKWAETHHDVEETVRQTIDIYRRYL